MPNKMITYGKQTITPEDVQAVTNAMLSDFLTQGPTIAEFEDAFAAYVGAEYAVAVTNGTSALHLSAIALQVKPGHKVITSPLTFSATANCIRYCGGEVVFADIHPNTFLLNIEEVKKLLSSSPKGTYQGILPIDFAGLPVNLEEFRALANEYGLWILEDACHAPGAYFKDTSGNKQWVGNGQYADLTVFSLHPVKHITTGEGGVITTNNPDLYQKLLLYRTHGITRNAKHFKNTIEIAGGAEGSYPPWYMELQELGYNYRITDIQAALGISQLKRASSGIIRRKEIARQYDIAFKDHPQIQSQQYELQKELSFSHAYHLYVIEVQKRLELYHHLRNHDILPQVHYIPLHLMPYYQQFGWKHGDFPHAEAYYKKCLSLPMYPGLTQEEQTKVINCILSFFN